MAVNSSNKMGCFILFIAMVAWGYVREGEREQQRLNMPPPPPAPILSLKQLNIDRADNKPAAKRKYEGKRFSLTGIIQAIDEISPILNRQFEVEIKNNEGIIIYRKSYILVDDSYKTEIFNLKVGNSITVEGYLKFEGIFEGIIVLDD